MKLHLQLTEPVQAKQAFNAAFGLYASLAQNAAIGAIFTVVSIVRSYCLRRVFERLRVRASHG